MARREKQQKSVAFLVYPGFTLLELIGTHAAGNALQMSGYRVEVVGEGEGPVESDTPLAVIPGKTFAGLPRPDLLFVLGGGGLAPLFAIGREALIGYVGAAAETAELIVGVGAGSLILAAAGLLAKRPAATHWAYAPILEGLGARYTRKRWVEDGKFITTAGGSAGLDMGLELVAKRNGLSNARLIQLFAEYDPQPPFGPPDWSQADSQALAPLLTRRLPELQAALAGRPQVLAAVEAAAAGQVVHTVNKVN